MAHAQVIGEEGRPRRRSARRGTRRSPRSATSPSAITGRATESSTVRYARVQDVHHLVSRRASSERPNLVPCSMWKMHLYFCMLGSGKPKSRCCDEVDEVCWMWCRSHLRSGSAALNAQISNRSTVTIHARDHAARCHPTSFQPGRLVSLASTINAAIALARETASPSEVSCDPDSRFWLCKAAHVTAQGSLTALPEGTTDVDAISPTLIAGARAPASHRWSVSATCSAGEGRQ